MAEKGILVQDAATGESIACRDAAELDNDSNARVIQRVDITKGKLPTPFRNAANLLRENKGADGDDISDYTGEYGSGVFDTVLTVGDKSTLVVQVEAKDSTTGTVTIVPVLLEDDEITVQGSLAPQDVDFSSGEGKLKLVATEYDNFYIGPLLSWDVTGAHKIAIAILTITDGYLTVDVYGAVI